VKTLDVKHRENDLNLLNKLIVCMYLLIRQMTKLQLKKNSLNLGYSI